jgi:hypothetical protein
MGTAIRPGGRALTGTMSRPRKPAPAARNSERFSLAVVMFFILASSAISIYDLSQFIKVILM